MDIYFTIEERYIQALEEGRYGETAKALKLFNELLEADPTYARTYYQLGCIHYYYINDYQAAGYYFSKTIALEANFPDVYVDFIKLLVFLKREKQLIEMANKALGVAGVNRFMVYDQLGIFQETQGNFEKAQEYYKQALDCSLDKEEFDNMEEALKRVKKKIQFKLKYVYAS